MKEEDEMTMKRPDSTQEILEMSREYNFYTWAPQKSAMERIAVKTGEGCYFEDYDGNKYLDAASQLVNLNIGYQNAKVVEAIKEQADQRGCQRIRAAHRQCLYRKI